MVRTIPPWRSFRVHGVAKRGLSPSLVAVAMLAALVVSVSLPARAEGQDLAKHFSGKTVTIIVATAPGDAYDVFKVNSAS